MKNPVIYGLRGLAYILVMILTAVSFPADAGSERMLGAKIYIERCAICHGNYGFGEGLLALQLHDFPDTRLMPDNDDFLSNPEKVREQIRLGGTLPELSDRMPPFQYELTDEELDAITNFVVLLQLNRAHAYKRIDEASRDLEPSKNLGRMVYLFRCATCHGKQGKGDGKRAVLITNPPPFDLTLSKLADKDLADIISKGGEAVGRSPQMPAWGTELNHHELQSLILHLKSLRQ